MVWGALLIFIVCPLLGGLPLIRWITYALTGQNLARLGTGNVSVSAAFYHGGNIAGILAVLSEAGKGIAAVLLARALFPSDPAWELIALIALVAGRYWVGRGAGTTNVVWGFVVHDWRVALFVFLIGGVGFTIWREKQQGRLAILVLVSLMVVLLHPHEPGRIIAAIALCSFIAGIYQKIPDDLDLRPEQASTNTQPVFRFFRGDKALVSLDTPLDANKVGQKAATLSQLTRWGYPVPTGWVLAPGDDPAPLIESVEPSEQEPLVVRSSAIGEDSEHASAAGQYESILNVTSKEALQDAINRVLASYDNPAAVQYRQDRQIPEDAIAVLIQKQVQGVFSGVAFSRDPISQQGDAVIIEGLPGYASSVVSGQVTPEQYRVFVPKHAIGDKENVATNPQSKILSWKGRHRDGDRQDADFPQNPKSKIEQSAIAVEGTGDLPPALIKQVAILARDLEARYHGVPQDIEWSYDGRALWLLQSRPITTLIPIWTRKIAAEVIPGLIRPLTWSINRPLTCGVWGEIYTLVLGDKARGLDFNETATLHYSRAYFNATLLGQIFRRMGLPPESLEFLTLGAKFSKPPLGSTLRNVPGLMRLLGRELSLDKDFQKDYKRLFAPILTKLASQPPSTLSPLELLERVDEIHAVLKRATYYSIMAPLSAALRQAIWRVKDTELDNSQSPEVASLRSLQELAADARNIIPNSDADLFANQSISNRFDQFLERYGYLSQVGTDIAVPTWKEDPRPVRELLAEFFKESEPQRRKESRGKRGGKVRLVQRRLNLKGRVTEVYSRLLAELRWCFVALENVWLDSGLLREAGDIFFLEFSEIRGLVAGGDEQLSDRISLLVQQRRDRLEEDRNLDPVPPLVYGNAPPASIFNSPPPLFQGGDSGSPLGIGGRGGDLQLLQGIGASPGQVEGRVKVLRNLLSIPDIDRDTILVVPYTDSGWAPLLARAGGLIAEVGGRLSHGAIVAREYGIPAVMDIHNASQILQDGQRVRIDGSRGIVEILP